MTAPARLQLLPASAGSGKTHSVTRMLTDEVESGQVAPERILAVTFTEAAASELRGRIRASVLATGDIDAAKRLDEAYISTIHGLGLRLLREFAFDLHSAVVPRLLTKDEQALLIRVALARSDTVQRIAPDLRRFGYAWTPYKGAAEDQFREEVSGLIRLLRDLGEPDPQTIAERAARSIRDAYGKPLNLDAETLAAQLRASCQRLLDAYPDCLAPTYARSPTAERDFSTNFDDLRSVVDSDHAAHDWQLWVRLCSLRLNRRGQTPPIPDDYVALAEDVMAVAHKIDRHPGPLADALAHIGGLFDCAADALDVYTQMKAQRGSVDFTDMVTRAARAMSRPELATILASRLDRIVVDEFQDTNPMQFNLVWKLVAQQVPATLVGDAKQSIMGFQGADARLFRGLLDRFPECTTPLPNNWRSSPNVLAFINAASAGLFEDYAPLGARAKTSAMTPVHLLSFEGKGWKPAVRAPRVAEVIRRKLGDSKLRVLDRGSGEPRRPRGSDVAILCPRNLDLPVYADALRGVGLKARFKRQGWFESEEVQIAWHALQLAADPDDRHAQLFIASSDIGSCSLQTAIDQVLDCGHVQDPCVDRLRELSDRLLETGVQHGVSEVLDAIELFDVTAQWETARQARANLSAILGRASEFAALPADTLAAQGYHGRNLPIFISWLQNISVADDTCPDAGVLEEDAVEVVTWHASKGREWPIVVVCGWDQTVEPRLPDKSVVYDSFDEFESLTERAGIRVVPKFPTRERREAAAATLQPEEEQSTRREIYVAISRAREQLVFEWPESALSGNALTRASLFEQATGFERGSHQVRVGDASVQADISCFLDSNAEPELSPAVATTSVDYGRPLLQKRALPRDRHPESVAPSAAQHLSVQREDTALVEYRYASPLILPPSERYAEVGTLVHRCFELGQAMPEALPVLLPMAEELWGTQASDVLDVIRSHVGAFEQMLSETLGVSELFREVDILSQDEQGAVVTGTIDCLGHGDGADWIIDHKTDAGATAQDVFARHSAQLRKYAAGIPSTFAEVNKLGVNVVREGVLIMSAEVQDISSLSDLV